MSSATEGVGEKVAEKSKDVGKPKARDHPKLLDFHQDLDDNRTYLHSRGLDQVSDSEFDE